MKKFLIIVAVLLGLNLCAKSQGLTGPYINFPDANFLKALINHTPKIDLNNDGKIDTTEAKLIVKFEYDGFPYGVKIKDLIGIEYFKNLDSLEIVSSDIKNLDISKNIKLTFLCCSINNLTSLDITKNINLKYLNCRILGLSSIDISKNTNLIYLNCSYNQLTSLDISKNINLTVLICNRNLIPSIDCSKNINLKRIWSDENQLKLIDVSKCVKLDSLSCALNLLNDLDVINNTKLKYLYCNDNNLKKLYITKNINLLHLNCGHNQLTSLDVSKNINLTFLGCNHNQLTLLDISKNINLWDLWLNNNPNLQNVCVWTLPFPPKSLPNFNDSNCSKNLQYAFCKGGIPYTNIVKGFAFFDLNKNYKKDTNENYAVNIRLNLTPDSFYINTNFKGEYKIFVDTGKYYFQPINPSKLYKIFPKKDSVYFKTYNQIDSSHNFAIQAVKDTAIFNAELTNVTRARPGFDLSFDINFKNEGTVCLTKGVVQMQYDTTKMTYISSTPNRDLVAIDTLMWNFNTLCPFQSSVVKAMFKVNPKTPIGTKLKIAYCMNADTSINKTTRNQFRKCDTLEIVVMGSCDPNDKAVSPDGSLNVIPVNTPELTYTIRFQNTGTDTAFNIYIKDTLSKNLDASTFNIVAASHANHYQLEKNILTVFFDNILLADSNTNEPMSHGYVKYKINPINIKEGTVIDNTAYIYFDFNDPVKTNTAKSILKTSTGVISEKYFFSNSIVYPNPASNELKVHKVYKVESVKIFNVVGRLEILKQVQDDNTIDISKLSKGIYIIELTTKEGIVRSKFIKE